MTRFALAATLLIAAPALSQPTTTAAERLREHVQVEVVLANVYDSNIERDEDPISSVGLVPGARLLLRDRAEDTRLTFAYTIARHAYTNTDRWNRTSHLLQAVYETEPAEDFVTTTEAEVSIRGSSEDRDLANQIQMVQAAELRLGIHRVEGYATLRYKMIPGNSEEDAFKPNVGLDYQLRWPAGVRWEAGARWEVNREAAARGAYARTTLDGGVRVPISRRATVEVEVKRRLKRYDARFVEILNPGSNRNLEVLRRDVQWQTEGLWRQEFGRGLEAVLGVEVERRSSNDPDKPYVATTFVLGLTARL